MYVLGVTGGIGSGKSTVCKVFNVLGIPIFNSDEEARILMESDANLKQDINRVTGKDMYRDGKLDRVRMAEMIFSDEKILAEVNRLVHPAVFNHFEKWVKSKRARYVIMEAAILFESGGDRYTNSAVAVTAPFEERVLRVMNRNNVSRKKVMERIKHQISENEMVNRSDFMVNNAENVLIVPQVLQIHNKLINSI